MKYEDLNCNGVRDAGEPPLAGWVINTYDFILGPLTTTTDALGQYSFTGLGMGLYYVSEVQQPGWVQTWPPTVNNMPVIPTYSSIVTGVDFGNMRAACDPVDYDTCLAGIKDDFAGGTVESPSPAPGLLAIVTEMCQGRPPLNFDEPAFGQCFGHSFNQCYDTACCITGARLCMKLMATGPTSQNDFIAMGEWPSPGGLWSYSLSQLLAIQTAGADVSWDPGDTMTLCLNLGNLPISGGITSIIAALQAGHFDFLMSDETMIDYLELVVKRCCPSQHDCSISGTKFNDFDRDGVRDPGEPGVPGWTIELYYQGGPLYATAVTDAFGNYTFSGIPCTTYTVHEVGQSNWVQTYPSPNIHALTVSGPVTGVNFGNWRCAEKGDTCCTKPPAKMLAWYPLDETAPATSYDLAGNDNNGTQIGTFGFVPGKVTGAYQFGPGPANQDIVRVYNDPFVTIGPGDFSADAWIYPTSFGANCSVFLVNAQHAPCVDPIFDNRQWFFGGTGLDGVCFFVMDDNQGTGTGHLGLLMSSDPTPQTTFLSPPGSIALNQWQHVAATVSRSTGTGKLYLNGAVIATFTPIAGPLYSTNAGPILDIGHGTFLNTGGCYYTNRYFDGKIDELEIFNRELSGAEISSLYQAGSSGKCKVRCYLPRYVPFCKNDNQRLTTVTICNQTTMSTTFNWSMFGMASGAGCNFNGAGMTFSPANGVTPILSPGQCVSIPVTIYRPAGFVPGSIACYGVTVMDPISGATSTCHGAIVATNKWCPILADPTLTPIGIGGTAKITFTVGNDNDTPGNLIYRIEAVGGESDPDAQVISLNGLPPGMPVEGNIALDPGQTAPIEVSVTLTELLTMDTPEIILSMDIDDDGVPDQVMSAGIEPVLFPDCNGNGVDDALDIAGGSSLDANGNGVPDECEASCNQQYCRCRCGDANGDGSTNVGDAVFLISYIFKGGAAPIPVCMGDANGDGSSNVGDAVYIINYVFKGGLPPSDNCCQ